MRRSAVMLLFLFCLRAAAVLLCVLIVARVFIAVIIAVLEEGILLGCAASPGARPRRHRQPLPLQLCIVRLLRLGILDEFRLDLLGFAEVRACRRMGRSHLKPTSSSSSSAAAA